MPPTGCLDRSRTSLFQGIGFEVAEEPAIEVRNVKPNRVFAYLLAFPCIEFDLDHVNTGFEAGGLAETGLHVATVWLWVP